MTSTFGPETNGTDVVKAFPHSVRKKTFILSGITPTDLSTSTALSLASGDPAALLLLGPSQSSIQPLFDAINARYPKVKLIFITVDHFKLSSVRGAVDVVRRLRVPIDGIVCFPVRIGGELSWTGDGVEEQFMGNYLGAFCLVNGVLDMVPRGPAKYQRQEQADGEADGIDGADGEGSEEEQGGRVVLVSSSIRPDAQAWNFEDPGFEHGKTYHPLDGFAQSMFANVEFAKYLAAAGILSFSVNPGNTKTNLHTVISEDQVASWLQRKKEVGEDLPLLLQQGPKSLSQGCATVLRALLDPSLKANSGAFLDNCQVRSLPHIDFPIGEESARLLWRKSEEMVGEKFRRL